MPYVTAAIEPEDPFLHHATNGIDMYVFMASTLSVALTVTIESFMRTIPT